MLAGDAAKNAVGRLSDFVSGGSSGHSEIHAEELPRPPEDNAPPVPPDSGNDEGHTTPDAVRLGRAVAAMAELLEQDLEKDLSQIEVQSEKSSKEAHKSTLKGDASRPSAEIGSMRVGGSRKERYNEFYYSKLKPMLDNLGLSDYDVNARNDFKVIMITPPRNR